MDDPEMSLVTLPFWFVFILFCYCYFFYALAMLQAKLCPLKNSYAEVLNPSASEFIFRNGVSKEVIELKLGHIIGP